MNFNNEQFPEYNQNQNEDMYPDRDANFTGWVFMNHFANNGMEILKSKKTRNSKPKKEC